MLVQLLTATLLMTAQSAVAQTTSGASAGKEAERRKVDIAQHRRLAEVHEAAAKCLEGGKSEKECHEQLARDCKGAGIGKFCGMRHTH